MSRHQILQLKRENEELVRSLYKVNEKLRDSERLKGHFISNITNEIVNPFASILALAENIKRMSEGEMAQVHRMAELIFEEAFHLDFQLKNVFVAALIEAGKEELNFSVIRINELSDHVCQYFKNQMAKNNIRLSVDFTNEMIANEPISFTSDREKLDLILKNLISNSIKYSPEGSVIDLNFVLGKGKLSMEVSDHGKGINPVDRQVIFDRFKQLDEKINSINTGHGLGLSIVLACTEMLGGKVSMNDNYKGGIRVMVSIPESVGADEWEDLEDFLLDSEVSY
ncbi:MAG TPA: HAMP domain-containing sensor histidine kinase [Prolixibacteraceae bacterium]|nr:HAMP domain-containing sensor histidine kinase [Prolixibacteraceae bacterium]